MSAVAMEQRKRIHPHKFTVWVGIVSILLMFAGLTSAYLVKRNQANWISFELPNYFWISTAAILLSSVTIYLATKAFRERDMTRPSMLMTVTVLLGMAFLLFQVLGFYGLWNNGITLQN